MLVPCNGAWALQDEPAEISGWNDVNSHHNSNESICSILATNNKLNIYNWPLPAVIHPFNRKWPIQTWMLTRGHNGGSLKILMAESLKHRGVAAKSFPLTSSNFIWCRLDQDHRIRVNLWWHMQYGSILVSMQHTRGAALDSFCAMMGHDVPQRWYLNKNATTAVAFMAAPLPASCSRLNQRQRIY